MHILDHPRHGDRIDLYGSDWATGHESFNLNFTALCLDIHKNDEPYVTVVFIAYK